MKTICFLLLIVPGGLLACNTVNSLNKKQASVIPAAQKDTIPESLYCIAMADAQKILGQVAHMREIDQDKENNGYERYRCTYTASQPEPRTDKTGNLYYSLEQYADSAAAKKAYAQVIDSNKDMPGQSTLNIGTQGYFHTDSVNFYFIMIRSKDVLLKMKVNRLTSFTSKDELINVTRKIVSQL